MRSIQFHRRRPLLPIAAMVFAGAFALASCGGGDEPAVSDSLAAESAAAAAKVASAGGDAALAVASARSTQGRAGDARRVRQVIVFGDSLSDSGTYRVGDIALAGGGKYTTNPGPIWSETIGLVLGTRVTPYQQGGFGFDPVKLGGTSYAMGGARVFEEPGYKCEWNDALRKCTQQLSHSIARQIDEYLAEHGSFRADQLVLVLGGPNDVFYHLDAIGNGEPVEAALGAIYTSALALAAQVGRIAAHGATRIVVLNSPPMAPTPFGKSQGPQVQFLLQAMVATFNDTFGTALNQAQIPGVLKVDLFAQITDILERPQAYLVRDTENVACTVPSSLVCSSRTLVSSTAPLTFMFADSVHPTTLTHLIIARNVLIAMWRNRMI